ncbi:hypothetical protein FBALC1_03617 [Flavobacteriales bacterium ALC-1]|nr:hypothetical protein FBALC1_03617 [Flavobacteriales bacterium ALC-1]
MKTKFLTLLVLLSSSIMLAQDEWQTLEQDNYSISYPKDWVSSDEKPQPSVLFLLKAPENSQKEDLFRESINLVSEPLGGQTLSIEDYVKISLDQIMAQIPSAEIKSNKETKLGDEDAREVVWSADFGNGMVLQFKQVYIINNGTAYVLTFSSTTSEYDAYDEVVNKTLNSFKFSI